MKKILKFIGLFFLINIVIWGVGFGISYLLVKRNHAPLITRNSEELFILNGFRRDGIIYSYVSCKNDTSKILFTWQDYKCLAERIFENGIYKNELGVEISKEVFEYAKEKDPTWFKMYDIDTNLDQATYYWMKDVYEHDGKEYKWCRLEEKDPYGVTLFARTDERIPLLTKEGEYTCNNEKKYCFIGIDMEADFIRTEYKDGECTVPENICELLKDRKVQIFHPETYYKYCME